MWYKFIFNIVNPPDWRAVSDFLRNDEMLCDGVEIPYFRGENQASAIYFIDRSRDLT